LRHVAHVIYIVLGLLIVVDRETNGHIRCYREHRKPSHWVTPISTGQDRVPRMVVLAEASGLPVLQVVLRVLQMVRAGRVSSSNGTNLEMTLQNITSAKGVVAKKARVGTFASVWRALVFAW
jgi:hypothetical protein